MKTFVIAAGATLAIGLAALTPTSASAHGWGWKHHKHWHGHHHFCKPIYKTFWTHYGPVTKVVRVCW